MSKNTGEPAFPCAGHESGMEFDRGMTLRDYAQIKFAAAWIVALSTRCGEQGYTDRGVAMEANRLAELQADAMLAEREKE